MKQKEGNVEKKKRDTKGRGIQKRVVSQFELPTLPSSADNDGQV
jgi:hypothetical protein